MRSEIADPGHEPKQEDCDCDLIGRWQSMAKVFGACCAVLITGSFLMGVSLYEKNAQIQTLQSDVAVKIQALDAKVGKLEMDLEIKPRDVLEEIRVLKKEVNKIVKQLEMDLEIKPRDVLEEIHKLRKEMLEILLRNGADKNRPVGASDKDS